MCTGFVQTLVLQSQLLQASLTGHPLNAVFIGLQDVIQRLPASAFLGSLLRLLAGRPTSRTMTCTEVVSPLSYHQQLGGDTVSQPAVGSLGQRSAALGCPEKLGTSRRVLCYRTVL
jgi:hypothetical protein